MTKKDFLFLVSENGIPRFSICNYKIHYWEKDRFKVYIFWDKDFKLPEKLRKKYYQRTYGLDAGSVLAKTYFTENKANELVAKLKGWIGD